MEGSETVPETEGKEDGDEDPNTKSSSLLQRVKSSYTKRQWILLTCFGLTNLLSTTTLALQAPFYPAEAERKGASATEYGLVFGIFDFMIFVASPTFGKYINRIGPKRLYTVSVIVTSVAVTLFGQLDKVNDHSWFITLSFICRIVEGLGCAGFFPATLTIIACEFPDSTAGTFSIIEIFVGLGSILGPTIGEALYTVGGFTLPFTVVGIAQLLSGMLSLLIMPKMERATSKDGSEQEGIGIMTLLKIPSVVVISLSLVSCSMSMEYLSAVLEPHIRQFSLAPMQVGLMFVASGGMYAVCVPICGYICDRMRNPMNVALIGNILHFIAFLLIGPASFMPFETTQWVTIVGLLIQGVGIACCLVSGFSAALKNCVKHGLPDNIATNGAVSGLWQSMMSLGAWVGPVLAGVLYDQVGFREGSWLILISSFIVGALIVILRCVETRDTWKEGLTSESQSLIEGAPPHSLHCHLKQTCERDTERNLAIKSSSMYGSISDK